VTRHGRRLRIGRCVYRDATGIAATVHVGLETRERRFEPETDRDTIKRWQDTTRAELRKFVASPVRATFAASRRGDVFIITASGRVLA
jgi:hypothetical protein